MIREMETKEDYFERYDHMLTEELKMGLDPNYH